jgi:hypothetical protein
MHHRIEMYTANKIIAFAISVSVPNCYRMRQCKSGNFRAAALLYKNLET